ncbi:MAG TPA: hypothetical protein V6D17_17415 [Candidatus Obscuribacterales bacterium]
MGRAQASWRIKQRQTNAPPLTVAPTAIGAQPTPRPRAGGVEATPGLRPFGVYTRRLPASDPHGNNSAPASDPHGNNSAPASDPRGNTPLPAMTAAGDLSRGSWHGKRQD